MPKRIKLDEFIQKQIEEDSIIVETPDGQTFTIPPALLWPEGVADKTNGEAARLLLGDDWDAFTEAGGTSAMVIYWVLAKAELSSMGESSAS